MRGFTLIELLLTMGIFSVIFLLSSVSFVKIQKSYLLSDNIWQLAAVLRRAQSQAAAGKAINSNRLKFGVLVKAGSYQEFATLTDFNNREESYDLITNLPQNLEFVDLNLPDNCLGANDCLIFASLTGTTSANASIGLKQKNSDSQKVIHISQEGNVYF